MTSCRLLTGSGRFLDDDDRTSRLDQTLEEPNEQRDIVEVQPGGRFVEDEKVSALRLLRYLVEEHAMSGAGLSRLLGASRQLGPMILRGEREITAAHARALGTHFGLPAGAFIE